MKNKIIRLAVITCISVILSLGFSHLGLNFLYSEMNEEAKSQVISIEELLTMRLEALQMCVQLSSDNKKYLEECLSVKEKIVDDVYVKLDTMPYTKFFFKYLDPNNSLEEIDKLQDMNLLHNQVD